MADVSDHSDLYGLPLEEFTTERNLLVRRLREEGKKEDAAQIAAARKPTTDAWALNQAARRRPELIEELIAAHQRLRGAESGDAMRQASDERHRLVDDIGDAAAAALEEAGHSSTGTVRERINLTLLATASDPEAEQALARGTLDRAVEISAGWPTTLLPRREETAPDDSTHAEEIEELETKVDELTAQAEQLRRDANEARAALEQAREQVQQAEQLAREAEKAMREAQRELKLASRRR